MPFSAPGSALNSRRRSKSAVSISVGTLVSVDLPSATRVAADSVGVRLAAAQSRNARPNCSFPMHFCRFATLIVPPSQELLDAFEQCSSPIPLELDGGVGDGAVPPPIEHTATQVPASDLAIEVLAYLSRELDQQNWQRLLSRPMLETSQSSRTRRLLHWRHAGSSRKFPPFPTATNVETHQNPRLRGHSRIASSSCGVG